MEDTEEYARPKHPLLRIITLGEFAIERLVPVPSEVTGEPPRYERVARSEWGNRGPAMTLLKVLVCRPNRRATREELIEAIWPDNAAINTAHTLESAASVLRRHILRSGRSTPPTRSSRQFPSSVGTSCAQARWGVCCSRCAAAGRRSSNWPASSASGSTPTPSSRWCLRRCGRSAGGRTRSRCLRRRRLSPGASSSRTTCTQSGPSRGDTPWVARGTARSSS